MGKPAATARPCLRSLSHSFTLDFVVLCNGTKAEAQAIKQELGAFLSTMGLTLSEDKTKVTHITEGFDFLGYRVIRSIGTKGKMAPKVLVPDKATKRFRDKVRAMLAPHTTEESIGVKIQRLNGLTRGWCEYYRCTSSPSWVFSALRAALFWDFAHWLGRKYESNMPAIMRRFRKGDTFGTSTIKLIMPTEYKAKRFVAKTWYNPHRRELKVLFQYHLQSRGVLCDQERPRGAALQPGAHRRFLMHSPTRATAQKTL